MMQGKKNTPDNRQSASILVLVDLRLFRHLVIGMNDNLLFGQSRDLGLLAPQAFTLGPLAYLGMAAAISTITLRFIGI